MFLHHLAQAYCRAVQFLTARGVFVAQGSILMGSKLHSRNLSLNIPEDVAIDGPPSPYDTSEVRFHQKLQTHASVIARDSHTLRQNGVKCRVSRIDFLIQDPHSLTNAVSQCSLRLSDVQSAAFPQSEAVPILCSL